MKTLTAILFLLFTSCQKNDVTPIPETCDFGVEYSFEKRPFNPDQQSIRWIQPNPWNLSRIKNLLILDFDGHEVSGTAWNYNGDFSCAPSGLTQSEIQTITENIARYFYPFDVTVSTNENMITVANNVMRLVLTESWEWYKSKVGGVAYTNSFSWKNNTPCFVFTSLLGYHVENISLAGAHELGHTIGLRHQALWIDCILKSAYNTNGLIMGKPYGQPIVFWGIGPTPYSCTDIQNDKSILHSKLGYR